MSLCAQVTFTHVHVHAFTCTHVHVHVCRSCDCMETSLISLFAVFPHYKCTYTHHQWLNSLTSAAQCRHITGGIHVHMYMYMYVHVCTCKCNLCMKTHYVCTLEFSLLYCCYSVRVGDAYSIYGVHGKSCA